MRALLENGNEKTISRPANIGGCFKARGLPDDKSFKLRFRVIQESSDRHRVIRLGNAAVGRTRSSL